MSIICFVETKIHAIEKQTVNWIQSSQLQKTVHYFQLQYFKKGQDIEENIEKTDSGDHKKNYSIPQAIIQDKNILTWSSSLKRTFRPISKGSFRGSTFQLSAAAIGSGSLSLPYVMAKNGFILGLLMIIIGCISTIVSLMMLGNCLAKIHPPNYTYLISEVIGMNVDHHIGWLIIISAIGSNVSYLIAIIQMIQVFAANIGLNMYLANVQHVKIAIAAFISLIILLPFGLTRNFSGFRYLSIFSISSLVYIMLVLLYELPDVFFFFLPYRFYSDL
ncbi:UNKNOWN [Stylonychia lemnae]|uniref:Amino acid transporter transmembrane domain-containing protein n=1 Tax=Stylonychia lemnae TaxID=5949 RepID=A0A078A9R2_STYLE|nr:UNKNOWN [Stylonychia lemnae]|eukprot:CDW78626.1 UNKNOWN [Stylonychia lemnae]